MPIRSKSNESKKEIKELMCAACGKHKKETDFYKSYIEIHSITGRIPYCKDCLKNMITDANGEVQIELLKKTLKLINKPFISDLWENSYEDGRDVFGIYIKNLGMKQYRNLIWEDSDYYGSYKTDNNEKPNYSKTIQSSEIEITEEMTDKWGSGYTTEEYYYFEKKWAKLIDNYGEKTSLHVEGLLTYIRFRVKEELATARGDIKDAKDWGAMASAAAKDAKLNVSQLSKSDISGGVDLLPQLFEAVESEVGIISILPHLKEQPYDDADMIIWCIVNYLRGLEGKPRIKYREIWNFYDKMLEEYFISKGYSSDMIEKEKIKRNNIFRDMEDIYKEPLYEGTEYDG